MRWLKGDISSEDDKLLPLTLTGFRLAGGLGFSGLGTFAGTSSLSLEELSVEDSELVLSTLDEVIPSLPRSKVGAGVTQSIAGDHENLVRRRNFAPKIR